MIEYGRIVDFYSKSMTKFELKVLLLTAAMLTNKGFSAEIFFKRNDLCFYNSASQNIQLLTYTFEECKPLTRIKILSPIHSVDKIMKMFKTNKLNTLQVETPIKAEKTLIAKFIGKIKMCCCTVTFESQSTAYAPITDMSCFRQNDTTIVEAYFNEVDTKYFTKNVTDMHNMFFSCQQLEKIDLSGLDTSNVTNMSKMFRLCVNLKEIDLSNFNTSNVTDMSEMFANCLKLEKLDISNFDMRNVKSVKNMFFYCKSLRTLTLPKSEQHSNRFNERDFTGCINLHKVDYLP